MVAKTALSIHTRLAGSLLLGSIVALFVWRLVIVETILGPVNPAANLSGATRDLLACGLLAGSLIATIGFTLLARQLRPTTTGRLALIGQYACQAAPVVLTIGMLGNLFNPAFQSLFVAFAVLTTGSWILFGLALWQDRVLRWPGILTALLGAIMLILILAGSFVIFIMSIALLPLGLGLLVRRQSQPAALVQTAGSPAD